MLIHQTAKYPYLKGQMIINNIQNNTNVTSLGFFNQIF
jgi:hypothetical protein